jgi:hypothetical protein
MVDHAATSLGHAVRLSTAHWLSCPDPGTADNIRDQYDSLAPYAYDYYIAFRCPHLFASWMQELGQISAQTPQPVH